MENYLVLSLKSDPSGYNVKMIPESNIERIQYDSSCNHAVVEMKGDRIDEGEIVASVNMAEFLKKMKGETK